MYKKIIKQIDEIIEISKYFNLEFFEFFIRFNKVYIFHKQSLPKSVLS
ncbi:hypothetical protein LEP1GSC132_0617 [Leptospira kirschneri str. 200803703]|uniref:Uncharacterized protein n=2 Tax=Leptospira kirschneri TaxID=29507 RepID=A0A828YB83_9LEPT|nr:hypothetical protein LEP1GSC044_0347 [Leptospira kirschneri serovar Grippotyphosa str. RM52]EKO53678.1 hypothetical protein LEP1GSC131_3187 [Leptospira kirschneri str. 200802841]EKO62225.1 hypothetical protein LEP1GSC082_3876 [Leptospira kirschneri str. H2]EKP03658.1 hypothetical protein LEP1GSC018_3371 [Leptospira kirschneri str. 2008720114]EKQ85688.1 hypothetical protein LEP1GSC064_0804 [Leptospira kirschneri serovar Grippotyphosa str. Moskva]EKR09210.1 hypothetical protein LEP1GSC122_007